MPLITGTETEDNLNGTADDDTIDLLGGNDIALGLGGNDVINGGAGNDQIPRRRRRGLHGALRQRHAERRRRQRLPMWGGAGVDTSTAAMARTIAESFYALNATQGAVANLFTQTISNDGFGNAETMTGVESLRPARNSPTLSPATTPSISCSPASATPCSPMAAMTSSGSTAPPRSSMAAHGNDTIGFVGDTNGMLVADDTEDGLADTCSR